MMSQDWIRWMAEGEPKTPVAERTRASMQEHLASLVDMQVYGSSMVASGGALYFLARRSDGEKFLGIVTQKQSETDFRGEARTFTYEGHDATVMICPTTRENARTLRHALPLLNPRPLGLAKSAGLGDRLGLATPGHIRALRAEAHANMQPIFAQQSMRENARTGRHPLDVLDDAMWGVFQEGWQDPWGADADHLKTLDDVDLCTAAGYTFFTIDPGEHVDDRAAAMDPGRLQDAFAALPWELLESSPSDLLRTLGDKEIDLDGEKVSISKGDLMLAAVKYGRAVAHTLSMYRRLVERMGESPFDLEVSVDETAQVTSVIEHIYIASELKRLGVRWVSMAPRYVGEFEKGVDYIGDLAEFERDFTRHTRVMQRYGPYKLSLHSGSDKFSIYPIASKVAGEFVHLKTAGTSYLEALRAISLSDAELFRRIMRFALERYETDRATYIVSGDAAKVEEALKGSDADLGSMLDNFDARQVLHVTFGSVLANEELREPFFRTLKENEALYDEVLEVHFRKHFAPFKRSAESFAI